MKSRSLNVRILNSGFMAIQTAQMGPSGPVLGPIIHVVGAQIGVSQPHVQVTRFNGRYYLSNGYHRVYGALMRKATHVPCVVRDVLTEADVGIRARATLDLQILQSANPPTLSHFKQAKGVSLRQTSQVITVSWNQTVVFDEYDG